MHVAHEPNLTTAALYAASAAVGIQSFDHKRDFIKSSALANATALVTGIGLLSAVTLLPKAFF